LASMHHLAVAQKNAHAKAKEGPDFIPWLLNLNWFSKLIQDLIDLVIRLV
jgi:hypothetical protein